jgi:hypothetical protein
MGVKILGHSIRFSTTWHRPGGFMYDMLYIVWPSVNSGLLLLLLFNYLDYCTEILHTQSLHGLVGPKNNGAGWTSNMASRKTFFKSCCCYFSWMDDPISMKFPLKVFLWCPVGPKENGDDLISNMAATAVS